MSAGAGNWSLQALMLQRVAAALGPELLERAGIHDFDTWAATFGQVVTEMELSVAGGDNFKLKERFAKFQNGPELLKMFHTFADVKTAEDLKLPTQIWWSGRTGNVCHAWSR